MKSVKSINKKLIDNIELFVENLNYAELYDLFEENSELLKHDIAFKEKIDTLLAEKAILLNFNSGHWKLFQIFLEKSVHANLLDDKTITKIYETCNSKMRHSLKKTLPHKDVSKKIFQLGKSLTEKTFSHIHNDHEIQGETVQGNDFFSGL